MLKHGQAVHERAHTWTIRESPPGAAGRATLSSIGLYQDSYSPAGSAFTGGPWSPASWKIAGTSGSAMNFP